MNTTTSGIVVVDKPAGTTSHDVVSQVRRLAGTRKVGHAGTLDPMATGVLLVGVNKATRLLGHLSLTHKSYDAVIRLGQATTTDDAEGEMVAQASAGSVTQQQVDTALARMVGEIEQVPSTVSAVKVAGRRAYARVRAGEDVVLPARTVTVHDLRAGALTRRGDVMDVPVSVRCSSGTYVRAIARDLGRALGVGGHLVALRRTAVGPFTLDEARTLPQLAERFVMVPIGEVARRCFPVREVTESQATDVSHGRPLPLDLAAPGVVAVFDPAGDLLGLYEQHGPVATPVAVLTG